MKPNPHGCRTRKFRTLLHNPTLRFSLLSCLLIGLASVSHAATFLWNVPTIGANDWNVNANWSPTGSPGASDTAVFGAVGTGGDNLTVNNVVSVNTTISALSFTNTTSGAWHVTQIPSGVTLSVTNLTVGFSTAGNSLVTSAAVADRGTLAVYGNMTIGNNGSSSLDQGTILDLANLSNFVYSGGTIAVASGNRSVANLNLAGVSNAVTAATLNLNVASSSSSGSGTVNLGAGTNIINAGAINIGAARSSCTFQFPAGASAAGLRLRGVGGTDADLANVMLGNHNNSGGSGSSCTGNLSLNGFPVDLKIGTLTLGRDQNSSSTGTDTGTGNFSFDTGTVSATNILMAITTVGNANGHGNGTINVGAANGIPATLTVGSGGISLVNQNASSGGCTGTLNLNGGNLNCAGNIFKTSVGGTANINMTGGNLSLGDGAAIGSPANPIDNFTVGDAVLSVPAANGSAAITVTTLTPTGSTNIINVMSVPGAASFPAQFQLIAYSSLAGVPNFGLGTLPGTYQGYLSNNTSSIDLVLTNSLSKSDVWRGNVSGNWDTTTLNWFYSGAAVAYVQGDSVRFDDTLTGTANVTLTADMSPGSITFNNASHNYTLGGNFKLTSNTGLSKQGSGTVTLAESGGDDFSGGMLVSDGTLILDQTNSAITGGLAIQGGTVQIGNNDAGGALPGGAITDNGALVFARIDNVTVGTVIVGSGSFTQNGTGMLTLTGPNGYTGNTFINHGTLALSGAGTISNSTLVAVHGATLDVSALTQTLYNGLSLDGANLNVAVNSMGVPTLLSSSLSFGAGANVINVVSLPPVGSYPVTFTIIQSATPATGSGFNVSLGTLPAATPAYAGNVTQSADQTAVLLTLTSGPAGLRPTVTWSGGDLATSTNWSDRLNWQLPGEPGAGENVLFTSAATQSGSSLTSPGGGSAALVPDSFNNIVDGNVTVASLTYSNLASSYHNSFVNAGRSLILTNGLSIGTLDTGGTIDKGFATVSGGAGAGLSVSGGNAQVWLGSGTSSGSQAMLDLSALDTFNATVGRLLVGATINNVVNRPSGILYLAKTNSITASFQTTSSETGTTTANAALVVADCNGNNGADSYLYLGRVNTIAADIIAFARQKTRAHVQFNPLYANVAPYPSATFQGFSSSRVLIFDVGDGVGNTGTTSANGTADFTGGRITAMMDTLNVGRASGATTGAGNTTGILQFDAGTINANSVNIGLQPTTGSKVGIGTINVSSNAIIGAGATLVVNGPVTLGSVVGGTGATSTSGTLNVTNGTVQAASIVPGAGSISSITVAGGRLFVSNSVGTATAPLGTLSLVPTGTPDNTATVLGVAVGMGNSGITVTTFNLDGTDTTTNVINVVSVGPVDGLPVELPLIKYGSMVLVSGSTFNIGLGTLPTGYSGYLTNDTVSSAVALVLTGAKYPQPVISGISVVSSNSLTISGTNGFANRLYYVMASPDVSLPLINWTPVATNVFGPDGSFSFTAPISPAIPNRFFRLLSQ